jgi:hypothetical protein
MGGSSGFRLSVGFRVPRIVPELTSGVYTEVGMRMLVSRGYRNHTGIPRFLNNTELFVAILKMRDARNTANLPCIYWCY